MIIYFTIYIYKSIYYIEYIYNKMNCYISRIFSLGMLCVSYSIMPISNQEKNRFLDVFLMIQ